jgi:outer membrane immunogenic protein
VLVGLIRTEGPADAPGEGHPMKPTIRALLLGSAASLVMAGAALAADLRGSISPPTYTNWTGFYAGVNGGYGWNDDAIVFNSVVGLRPNPSGALFGGQVGYNWQFAPDWVFGVETDFAWSDIFGSALTSVPGAFTAVERVNMLGTLRGRVGYALENVLLYGTAGIAYGRTDLATSSINPVLGACGPTGFCASAASTEWMVGWSAGVGFDWAFLPRWSFRSEYLHYDLGSRQQNLIDPGIPTAPLVASANFRGDILRGAINFKFW